MTGKVDISLEMGPTAHLWPTKSSWEKPHKLVNACRDPFYTKAGERTRTVNLLLTKDDARRPDSGDFRVEYGFSARSCPVRRRSITVLNRSARCNRDAKRVGLRCGAIRPHSGPQLRTRKTLFSGSASVAVE